MVFETTAGSNLRHVKVRAWNSGFDSERNRA